MKIAVIPARGGSKRIPRKNIKLFHGKPIIAYSIETAQSCGLFDEVYVSTDDNEISAVARSCHAKVIRRGASLANVGTQEVVADALLAISPPGQAIACCIYATAPLMCVDDLTRGLKELEFAHRPNGFAFSVGTKPLRDAAQFYWGLARAFMERRPLISPDSVMVPIDESRVCDINVDFDWQRAERLYKWHREREDHVA